MSEAWEDESKPQPTLPLSVPQGDAPPNPPGAGRPAGEEVVATEKTEVEGPKLRVVTPNAIGFIWCGIEIGTDWTPVKPDRVGPLLRAAREAGIDIEEQ